MLDVSSELVLRAEQNPSQDHEAQFIFWLIVGLLGILAVLLVVLGVVLVWYKRWMDQDARHKARVEEQLGRLAEVIERFAAEQRADGKGSEQSAVSEKGKGDAAP